MNTRKELFIFSDAARHLPEVDEWLAREPHELFSLARNWFTVFRQCGDESMKSCTMAARPRVSIVRRLAM